LIADGVRAAALGASLALAAGCSILNATDACDVGPGEVRVNARGDGVEHFGSSRGAAMLADGRMIAAVVSSNEDGTSSEVRASILESGSGTHNTMCNGQDTERVLSDPATIAFRASAVAVDVPDVSNPLGNRAVAAIGWTSAATPLGDRSVTIQLLDDGGCDVGVPFPPVLEGQTGPVQGLGLAWSEVRGALFTVFHDGRRVLGAWIEAPGSTSVLEELATEDQVIGDVAVAFAPDGRGLVAWEYAESAWIGRGEVGVHAALIDADGRLRPAALAQGAAPFRVDAGPSYYFAGHVVSLTVAVDASADAYALAYETADADDEPSKVRLRAFDPDGTPRTLGTAAAGGALEVDRGGAGARVSPSVRFLPGGDLLASWESTEHDGTMALVLDDEGRAAFTGVACDEGSFSVGARNTFLPGSSSAVVAGSDLWIFHAGDSADDPVVTAALGWRTRLDEMLPGEKR